MADFQVAGGLILLALAVRELVGFGRADRNADNEFGVVPLGMPLIAGPALVTALLILIDSVGVVFTLLSLIANLAIVAIALCNAERFARLMGRQGLRGISKIIALLAGGDRDQPDPPRLANALDDSTLSRCSLERAQSAEPADQACDYGCC